MKEDVAKEGGAWSKFRKHFNKNIKVGCYDDDSNKSKLSNSCNSPQPSPMKISIWQIIGCMQESQESVYYMSG